MSTLNLSASGSYGNAKQYVARITGRDSKFTFSREFIGRKSGKRGESTEATVDEPGLYMTCDVDRKGGKDETFILFDGERDEQVTLEQAMEIAKRMQAGSVDFAAEITAEKCRWYLARLESHKDKPLDETITVRYAFGRFGHGEVTTRREVVAEFQRLLAEIDGSVATPEPVPTDECLAAMQALVARFGIVAVRAACEQACILGIRPGV